MSDVVSHALEIAVDAARRAGEFTRWNFDDQRPADDDIATSGAANAVVPEARSRIVDRIRWTFPDHRIDGESSRRPTEPSEWTWFVNPLDGVRNVSTGLSLYGSTVTLHRDGEPVLSVVHDAHNDRTTWARSGKGVYELHNGCVSPVRAHWVAHDLLSADVCLARGNASAKTLVGRELARRTTQSVKRMHDTGAPSADWILLASGGLDAVVLFDVEARYALGGMHLAREVGAELRTFEGKPWTSWSSERVRAVVSSPHLIHAVLEMIADEGDVVRSIARTPTTKAVSNDLVTAVRQSWSDDTAYGPWSPETPSSGQCGVTALVVQDELGGQLLWTSLDGANHVFNRIESGEIVDLTRDQFDTWQPSDIVVTTRFRELSQQPTIDRYLRFRQRVNDRLPKRQ